MPEAFYCEGIGEICERYYRRLSRAMRAMGEITAVCLHAGAFVGEISPRSNRQCEELVLYV